MDVRTEAERMNIATVRCNIPLKGKYIHTATSSCGLLIRYSQTVSTAEEIRTRLDRIPFQTSAQVNLASTDLHSFSHIVRRMNQNESFNNCLFKQFELLFIGLLSYASFSQYLGHDSNLTVD